MHANAGPERRQARCGRWALVEYFRKFPVLRGMYFGSASNLGGALLITRSATGVSPTVPLRSSETVRNLPWPLFLGRPPPADWQRNADGARSGSLSFRDWAAAEFDTSTGRAKGANATAEILLPIAVVAVGMTVLGLVFPYHCKRRRWSMANVAGSRRA